MADKFNEITQQELENILNQRLAIIGEKLHELSGGDVDMYEKLSKLQEEIDLLRLEMITPEKAAKAILTMMEDRVDMLIAITERLNEC